MEPADRIAVKLTPESIVALKVLVDKGEFESMSDAMRKAIDEFILSRFTPEEIDIMASEVHVELVDSDITGESRVEAMNKAIHEAVTKFVRGKMESKDDEESSEEDEDEREEEKLFKDSYEPE